MRASLHLQALIGRTGSASNSPVILYNNKLCLVRLVLNRKDLSWTEIDSLPYFCQQRQSRPLVENMNRAIAISLLEHVGAGEYTVTTRNTLLGIRDHAHVITSLFDMLH
jgi:hypothetical protein